MVSILWFTAGAVCMFVGQLICERICERRNSTRIIHTFNPFAGRDNV